MLLASTALFGCSPTSIPSYTSAPPAQRTATTPKSQYQNREKATAQRPHREAMHVARPSNGDSKVDTDITYTGSAAPGKDDNIKPFSKEWDERQAEEHRRLDAAITICRGC
jgi:hypothetical protein